MLQLPADLWSTFPTMVMPAIVLVEPQLGQNIGMVARAMKNFSLSDLRLVAPRDGWPNPEAVAASSGAQDVIDGARFFPTLEAAIGDLSQVYATSARPRDMSVTDLPLTEVAHRCQGAAESGLRTGVLFGRERWGLTNKEIALCDALVTYPTNPDFASLNLAQAVLLFGYAYFSSASSQGKGLDRRDMGPDPNRDKALPASRAQLLSFSQRLDDRLAQLGYYHPPEREEIMRQNWQNLLIRMELSAGEINLLHGLLTTLERDRPWGEAAS